MAVQDLYAAARAHTQQVAPPPRPQGTATVAASDITRRPDGTAYVTLSSEGTSETPTQLLNQGFRQEADGTWARYVDSADVSPQQDIYADARKATAEEQVSNAVMAANPLGSQLAFQTAALEQAPLGDEASALFASLLTGQSYSDLRDIQTKQARFDRENYGAQRNLGGAAGFTAGLAVPVGSGYIQGARGLAQAGRAATVGSVSGAAYGFGAGDGSFAERAPGAVTGAVLGGATGAGVQAAAPFASRLLGISSTGTRQPSPMASRVADFNQVGIEPTLAGVGGPMSQRTAQTLAGNVMTGQPIAAAARRAETQTADAIDRVAGAYGGAEGRMSAGATLQRSAREGADTLRREGGALYEPINALDANPTPIPLTASRQAVDESLSVFTTPELRDWFTRNATDLAQFQDVLQKADQGVTFGEARQIRSIVGRMLNDPTVFNSRSEAGLRRLYGALSDDVAAGAEQLGGAEAAQALSRADTYYSAARSRADNVLARFYDAQNPADAYSRLIDAAKATGRRSNWAQLRQLRSSVPAEDWDEIASGVIRDLGRRGDDFSVARFATEWETMTPQARRILFGGAERSEQFSDLNALARVMRQQQQASRFYNYSESGNAAGNIGVGSGLALAGQQAMTGNLIPVATIVGAGVAGNGLSRILTSPGVARWLAGPVQRAVPDAESLARRNAAFAQWWDLNRDAFVRAAAQSDVVPMQAAAEESQQ